ncbi:hypothetical protein WJX74_009335 [Apatococcus lobatus]|uniref:Integral membrane protein TmpA n=1 Tax=Apatococcus lobatus TaxID=904363 RepID=A0AAW1S0C3_9CHLO
MRKVQSSQSCCCSDAARASRQGRSCRHPSPACVPATCQVVNLGDRFGSSVVSMSLHLKIRTLLDIAENCTENWTRQDGSSHHARLQGGAVAGTAVGAVALAIFLAVAACYMFRRSALRQAMCIGRPIAVSLTDLKVQPCKNEEAFMQIDPDQKATVKSISVQPAGADLPNERVPFVRHVLRWLEAFSNMYRVLFGICLGFNVTFLALAATNTVPYAKRQKAAFALGNIMVSCIVRNEIFMYGVYWLIVKTFSRWPPLWVRAFWTSFLLHIGGCHSGLAISSLMWIIYVLVDLATHSAFTQTGVIVIVSVLGALILITAAAAFPLIRFYHHNTFEVLHRFSGWTALSAVWVFEILASNWDSNTKRFKFAGSHFIHHQDFWFLVVTTYLIIQPWLFVRRVEVLETSVPSSKAILMKFKGFVPLGCLSRISRKPLLEWHAFGCISDAVSEGQDKDIHHLLITPLGDFTRELASNPPTHVYTRNFKFVGLPYCVTMFRSGVLVATGSGLGIWMSILLQGPPDYHLIWVGRDLTNTYGPVMMDLLSRIDPARVHLYDTLHDGRPDSLALTIQLVRQIRAEVVLVTSNPRGTEHLVNGCRAAGITAFGPIFDS